MFKRTLIAALVLLASSCAFAQTPSSQSPFSSLQFLVGDWVGEGDGGSGSFSFAYDLQNSVLVRRNHTEYPATDKRSALVHDDLLIIFPEGNDLRAMYWDNEKHVIRYTVKPVTDGVDFISEATEGAPRFRLTYRNGSEGKLDIAFEIAPPGKDFSPYLQGKARRVAPK